MTAPLIYSVYILAGSKLTKQAGVLSTSTVVILSASVVFGLAVLIQGLNLPRTLAGWGSVLAIALGSTVIAVNTFFAGLKQVGPTNASVLSTFEPVTTVILASLFFGEEIGLMRVVGGLLILLAVILLAKSELRLNG
jgi:drug/metabolite transporter (DMT)-like permease